MCCHPSEPGALGVKAVEEESEEAALLRAVGRRMALLLGLLSPRYLGTNLSLAESRVLYEVQILERMTPPTASAICQQTGMDKGQLSRVLASLERNGYLTRHPMKTDRRRKQLVLTATGESMMAELTCRSSRQAALVLGQTPAAHRQELLALLARLLEVLPRQLGPSPE